LQYGYAVAQREALIIEAGTERFRFYYDMEVSEVPGCTPEEAIRTFFEGETSAWDGARARFETLTETHGIYWARHAHDGSVIIISCFRRGDE